MSPSSTYQHRHNEVEALTIMLNELESVMTDQDLEAQLGAAIVDGDDEALRHLEQERDRRRLATERGRLADIEGDRRRIVAERAEHHQLIETWTARLSPMEAAYHRQLNGLSNRSDRQQIRIAYEVGLALYSLRHDLHAVDPLRFKRPTYTVSRELVDAAGPAADLFLTSLRNQQRVIAQPWQQDLARAAALVPPPAPTIRNGG